MDSARHLFRHTIATLAYRGGKLLREVSESFAQYRGGEQVRTPAEILAHIGDLLDWALSMAKGKQEWHSSTPLPWAQETQRFFAALEALDAYVASDLPLQVSTEKLFQGPIADALTHVGQIAILRRLAGIPVTAENYYVAEITAGRVGSKQALPKREF
ncbi:MAG: hypothetical protein WAK20_21035 [Candidatus Acidiferrum sp.]